MHHTQINGGFYSATGLRLAVVGAIPKLEGGWSPAVIQIAYRADSGDLPVAFCTLELSKP
jgi:hypothetical protein